jgi:hypothetical protein
MHQSPQVSSGTGFRVALSVARQIRKSRHEISVIAGLPAGFEPAKLSKAGVKIFFYAVEVFNSCYMLLEVLKKPAQPARRSLWSRNRGFCDGFEPWLRNLPLRNLRAGHRRVIHHYAGR